MKKNANRHRPKKKKKKKCPKELKGARKENPTKLCNS